MNWTGGRLQQSRRAAGGLTAQQKAYFAKARTKMLDGDVPRPALDFAKFGGIEVEPKYAGAASTAIPGEPFRSSQFNDHDLDRASVWEELNRHVFQRLDRPPVQHFGGSHGPQGTRNDEMDMDERNEPASRHLPSRSFNRKAASPNIRKRRMHREPLNEASNRHFIIQDEDIQRKRQELLQRRDWIGLATAKPLRFEPLGEQDQKRVARRRKLNEDDLVRRGTKRLRPTVGRHQLGTSASPQHGKRHQDEISIRHGTQIHHTQQTPISQHSSERRAREHIARNEGMLMCSSQDAKPCSKLQRYGRGHEILKSSPVVRVQKWLAEDTQDAYSQGRHKHKLEPLDSSDPELEEVYLDVQSQYFDQREDIGSMEKGAYPDRDSEISHQKQDEGVAQALQNLEEVDHLDAEALILDHNIHSRDKHARRYVKQVDHISSSSHQDIFSMNAPADVNMFRTQTKLLGKRENDVVVPTCPPRTRVEEAEENRDWPSGTCNQPKTSLEKEPRTHLPTHGEDHLDATRAISPVGNALGNSMTPRLQELPGTRQEAEVSKAPLKGPADEISPEKYSKATTASLSEVTRPDFSLNISFLKRPPARKVTLEEQNKIWYNFIFGNTDPASYVFDPKVFSNISSSPPMPDSSSPLPPRFPSSPVPPSLKSTAVQASPEQRRSSIRQVSPSTVVEAQKPERGIARDKKQALRSSSTDPLARYPDPKPKAHHQSISRIVHLEPTSTAATKAPSSPPIPEQAISIMTTSTAQGSSEETKPLPCDDQNYSMVAQASSSPPPNSTSPTKSSSTLNPSPLRVVFTKPTRFEGSSSPYPEAQAAEMPGTNGTTTPLRLGARAIGEFTNESNRIPSRRRLAKKGQSVLAPGAGTAHAGDGQAVKEDVWMIPVSDSVEGAEGGDEIEDD